MENENITKLLRDWVEGDERSLEQLAPLVYDQLHRIARNAFRGENAGHTLQATALVNEAFVKLVDAGVDWKDRAHFFALSARMMRRILIDHANARNAAKRGGGVLRVTMADSVEMSEENDADIVELHEALLALGERDARKAEIIELHYFGGLTYEEMEAVTGLSSSTLNRELRFAKAWLQSALSS